MYVDIKYGIRLTTNTLSRIKVIIVSIWAADTVFSFLVVEHWAFGTSCYTFQFEVPIHNVISVAICSDPQIVRQIGISDGFWGAGVVSGDKIITGNASSGV